MVRLYLHHISVLFKRHRSVVRGSKLIRYPTFEMRLDRFGKQHKHVLAAIKNMECSEEFNRTNFRPIDYTDATSTPELSINGIITILSKPVYRSIFRVIIFFIQSNNSLYQNEY